MQIRRKPPYSTYHITFLLFLFLSTTVTSRPFVLVLSQDDLKDSYHPSDDDQSSVTDWDDFSESETRSELDLDPASWRPIFEPEPDPNQSSSQSDLHDYYSLVRKLFDESGGDMEHVALAIEWIAGTGNPHAQSLLGFLFSTGMARPRNAAKAFMYHSFAAADGNTHSKLARAYTYYRQEAVVLYAELAEAAVNGFLISKDSPVIEPVRIHNGAEENKDALRKSKGEDDEDFLILEYQAQKGNAVAMYKIGIFYYFGLRGVRRDHAKALSWFARAVDKGEPRSMELLGEIYARGAGVKRNYTKALEWLTLASKQQLYSAYNGMGYLYVKGYGVEQKNYTKAKEYFEKAADNKEAGGHYNLGVMYLKGIGVKKDVKLACKYFIIAANNGQPKAFYQLAKMFHTGIGLKKNLPMGTERDYDRAADAYMHAKSQSNAQAMFNLGYMHEHGQGLLLDLNLAKRYYDQALEIDPAAKLPVMLALASLWIRRNYADTFIVDFIDSLPSVYPKADEWIKNVVMEEGNATILTLFVCLSSRCCRSSTASA